MRLLIAVTSILTDLSWLFLQPSGNNRKSIIEAVKSIAHEINVNPTLTPQILWHYSLIWKCHVVCRIPMLQGLVKLYFPQRCKSMCETSQQPPLLKVTVTVFHKPRGSEDTFLLPTQHIQTRTCLTGTHFTTLLSNEVIAQVLQVVVYLPLLPWHRSWQQACHELLSACLKLRSL